MNDAITWGVIAASNPEPIDTIPFNWSALLTVLVPIVVAAITGTFLVLSQRAQKGEREDKFIGRLQDQLRAQRDEARQQKADADTRSDKQDERMAVIEGNVKILQRVSRVRLDYIYLLRRHIDDGAPPPAPEWPPGIHD